MTLAPPRLLAVIALLGVAASLAGCGKAGPQAVPGGGPLRRLAPVEAQGAVSVTTRNTTRVGGADTVVDAASVARAVYPGLTAGSRPQAVVLLDQRNWTAALSAAVLAGAPLGAPILYATGNTLPAVSLQALEAMQPPGAPALGGTQVIRIGTEAPLPARFSVRTLPASNPAGMAVAIERLLVTARGAGPPRQVIVLRSGGVHSLEMPAAGLAAESGAPILLAEGQGLGEATANALKGMHHPSIYVINPGQLGPRALGTLAGLGSVTRIPGGAEGGGPAADAIAIARFTDGSFGWGIKEPGHGLVFANPARPLDAPAAALLSASADYGPLLLLEASGSIPAALSAYLGDIQPAYSAAPEFQPVRGVYNHGWLIGDEQAIPLDTQAELDSLLEISPRQQGASPEASVLRPE
jgi:predicted small lipoprotein YifL